jgi:pimeloyl-ACP methyl ester carboxylesterase
MPSLRARARASTRPITVALIVALTAASCLAWQRADERLPLPRNAPGRIVRTRAGRNMYVVTRGDAPSGATPVLLVHGFASSHDVWDHVEPALRARRQTIAVDLPGFGYSERFEGDYSPAALAEDLLSVLDQAGVARADVVGHSWGCSIALAFVLSHPDRVRRLVLVDGWIYDEQIPPVMRWAREGVWGDAIFSLFYDQRPEDRIPMGFEDERAVSQNLVEGAAQVLHWPGTGRAALAAARGMHFLQMERRYRTVAHPALLVWGAHDQVSPVRIGERLATEMPNARLEVVPRVGHFPMWENAPRLRTLMLAFLDGPADDITQAPAASAGTPPTVPHGEAGQR